MGSDPWVLGLLAVLGLEQLITLVQPAWLPMLTVVPIAERTFTSSSAPPALPARTALTHSLLFASGQRIALRRKYGWGNESFWLCAITLRRDGNEVRLRARQAVSPLLLVPGLAIVWVGHLSRMGMNLATVGLVGAFVVITIASQFLRGRAERSAAVDEAFDLIQGKATATARPATRRARKGAR